MDARSDPIALVVGYRALLIVVAGLYACALLTGTPHLAGGRDRSDEGTVTARRRRMSTSFSAGRL